MLLVVVCYAKLDLFPDKMCAFLCVICDYEYEALKRMYVKQLVTMEPWQCSQPIKCCHMWEIARRNAEVIGAG